MKLVGVVSYRVTSSNGAGVLTGGYRRLQDAKAEAQKIAAEYRIPHLFEIERVLDTEYGRQYWMRRGKRWMHWDALQDAGVRKPDFYVESGVAK